MRVREPDLIILDLHLDGDDGLDVLRELRTRRGVGYKFDVDVV